jgi:hypothetical protein
MINNRYVVSNHEPWESFVSKFNGSIPSVAAVAKYLVKQGHKLEVNGLEMRPHGNLVDKGDIWVLKDDGTPDYRVEVRQLTKEDFTCADDFRHPVMTHYFCIDWAKLDPKPKWVFIVNRACTHAAKIKCGNEVANWLVTNAPRYSSYAVLKDTPEYVSL